MLVAYALMVFVAGELQFTYVDTPEMHKVIIAFETQEDCQFIADKYNTQTTGTHAECVEIAKPRITRPNGG